MYTVGLRISGHRAAGFFIVFTEEHKSLGTNSTSTIHKSCAASCKHPRKQRSVARKNSNQRMVSSNDILNQTRGKGFCCRFRREHAHVQQERLSKSPTAVVAANGEVQTKEEAIVNVKELDLFVTVKLLEDTPAVLSLGKLCEDHGYSYHWTSGRKLQLVKDGRRIRCNTANYVPIVVLGFSTGSSSSAYRRKLLFLHSIPHQQEVRVQVALR